MLRTINKLLLPFQRKLMQIVSRGVVNLANDSLKMQEIQITLLADETLDSVERVQDYGFTSVPKPGSECITVSVNGNRGHVVAIAVDDKRYRLKSMQSGEVAVYDDIGNFVKLGRNNITVNAVAEVNVNSPVVNINADTSIDITSAKATINGNLTVTGDVVAGGISLITHTHPGDSGGTTGQPI